AGRAGGSRACAGAGSCGSQRDDERAKTQTRGASGRTRATAAAADRRPSGADAARAADAAGGGRHARRADPPSAEAGARGDALAVGNIGRSLARRKKRAPETRYAVEAARAIMMPRVPSRPSLWSDGWLR